MHRISLASLAALALMAVAAPATAQVESLLTAPERTDWVETTRYGDALALLESVAAASSRAHLTRMGYSSEGRAIPLLVFGDVADASPEAVLASGRLRVYLQGNIHGGEVPGKEALLMLVRDLASQERPAWLDELVLLVAPIYNVDGNERVALTNRPRQNGPLGGMGQRPNAQGLDLNRDHMKLDSPEARSLVGMLNAYDPEVAVDLHTTNGTRHAYHLTYSPALHPGTAVELDRLLRNDALPGITQEIRRSDGWEYYYYGNARRDPNGEMGWYTFDHRPRFNNNYVGLRNRVAILSEAYAYATFQDRVRATRRFVEEVIGWSADSVEPIRTAIAAAQRPVAGSELPLRATFEGSAEPVEILMGAVEELRHPYTGALVLNRLDTVTPTPMREYGTFWATESGVVPTRYLIPAEAEEALIRLRAHGVGVSSLSSSLELQGEVFRVDSVIVSERPFQGRRERVVHGDWMPVDTVLPEGTRVVDTDQPLGRLAFYLLEPRSDDGFANWGILGDSTAMRSWPVLRVR